MWTVLFFLNLGALCGAVSSSPPSPAEVSFSSVNLRNLLQWSPGKGTPNDTHYSVQYAIYGDSVEGSRGKRVNWRSVQHCTKVVRCWCDLSSETRDLEQGYHARVRAVSEGASSKWASTRRRFDPKSDTVFGHPSVIVDIEDNNAIITIKGPMRYQPNNQTPAVPMAKLYDQMTYNVSVHNIRSGQMSHFPVDPSQSRYKYRLMEYDTEYCFSAVAKFPSMPLQCQPSEWHCLTTPPDPWVAQLQWVFVGIIVPSACICIFIVIGYLLYQYLTGKGQKSPYTLNPPSFHSPPLTFPPETPSFVPIKIGLPLDQDIAAFDLAYPLKKPIPGPPPGYTPQRSETSHEPEGPCNDLSVDYGFVCQAGEGGERRHLGGVEGNNQRDASQEWRVEGDHFTEANTPQTESFLSQRLISASSEASMPIQSQTGVLTLVNTHACLQAESVVPYQSQRSGLFIGRAPQTFNIPLNVESKAEEGMSEEMVGRSERAPLLSAYACQNIITLPTSQSDRPNYLPDDYGVLTQDAEKEEEEGSICISWDPKTGKLILPELGMELKKDDGLVQGEEERESKSRAEEEVNAMKGGLRLEAVFVRQGSEEKAEALREMERREVTGWEAGDPLSKWDLIIPMDQ